MFFVAPAIINGAFSAELGIKSILTENSIQYGKEHNLLELFMLLPKNFQMEMLYYFNERTPYFRDANEWLDELILISNSFIDWRYCFEDRQIPAINLGFLDAFAFAVFCTVTSHYKVDIKKDSKMSITTEELDKKFEKNRVECLEQIIESLATKRMRRKK